jgi:hypothetical protein
MRIALTAFVLIAAAGTAGAQSHARRSTDELWKPTIGLPLPQIGLPLPQIGLPLPQLGLPPNERSERLERSERSERLERPERSSTNRRSSAILFVPAFGWPYLPATAVPGPPAPPPQQERATGRLRLDIQSGVDPQIFVDGYCVGMLSDVSGELTLDAGAHTLELREEGYDSLRVDVQISTDGLITYRGGLKPVGGTDLPVSSRALRAGGALPDLTGPRPEVPPTTIYVIPGCYIGNVPPKDAGLPAGCDEGRAVAFPSRP